MKKKIITVLLFFFLYGLSFNIAIAQVFEIVRVIYYHNAIGDRYAKITVRNVSGDSRILSPTDFIAVLANGKKVRGHDSTKGYIRDIRCHCGETATMMVYFSRHAFPIDHILVR